MHKEEFIPLSKLKPSQEAVVVDFNENHMPLKLLEMGLLPGHVVRVLRIAPLGDPMHISVSGYDLALRKNEACHIDVAIKTEEAKTV